MSSEALPITASRFAKALEELPISSLYAKHAELSNQITHLVSSNQQLEDYARENDDRDCYEALLENRQVMKRFEERKELIKKEVQDVRGLPWRPESENVVPPATTGTAAAATAPATNGASGGMAIATDQANGSGAHNAEEEEEEGVFL